MNYAEEVSKIPLNIDGHRHLMRGIWSAGLPDRARLTISILQSDCA
jgi:hypothetical protein